MCVQYISVLACLLVLAACGGQEPAEGAKTPAKAAARTPVADVKTSGDPTEYESYHLAKPLLLMPGVFPPQEADQYVLPFMKDHPQLFKDKVVFEIGTGSGMISLFAAELGAKRVVCTDISPAAIESVRRNAERMGFAAVIDPRLVPEDDISAYSTMRDGEVFDTIISNPPYALDLDAEHNTALVDKGELGFSIVRGFGRHLAKDGHACLFYNTLFYQGVMVKFAEHSGHDVRVHMALGMSPWAFEALFNMYLGRLLEREKLPKDAFRFYKEQLPFAMAIDKSSPPPLIGDGEKAAKVYRGFMVIRHKGQ